MIKDGPTPETEDKTDPEELESLSQNEVADLLAQKLASLNVLEDD